MLCDTWSDSEQSSTESDEFIDVVGAGYLQSSSSAPDGENDELKPALSRGASKAKHNEESSVQKQGCTQKIQPPSTKEEEEVILTYLTFFDAVIILWI